MKKSTNIHICIAIVAAILSTVPLSSCRKYEDGPVFSIHSKTSRVANTWKINKVTSNGIDKTSDYQDFRITLMKDGNYTAVSPIALFNVTTSGVWAFTDYKDNIQLTSTPVLGISTVYTYKILKLEEKDLWLSSSDGFTEFHLISA
jgi:hypothetical protein